MQSAIVAVAPRVLRALGRTVRIKVIRGDRFEALQEAGRPFIFVLWHGRILLPIYEHRDAGVVAMVSLSKDGDLTTAILGRLGYRSVRGSSSRGGQEAFHGLVSEIGAGGVGAVIPDGPRGPARVLKPGVIRMAAKAGVPILPLSAAAGPAKRLQSWDRFLLPYPFSRGVIVYGEPLQIPAALSAEDAERLRLELENRLNALDAEADARLGQR